MAITPRRSTRSAVVGAVDKGTGRGLALAGAVSTTPLAHTRRDQMDTDHHDSNTGDNRGEDLLQDLGRQERQDHGQETADHAGTQESTPGVRAGHVGDVSSRGVNGAGAESRGVHVGNRGLEDRKEDERGTDD